MSLHSATERTIRRDLTARGADPATVAEWTRAVERLATRYSGYVDSDIEMSRDELDLSTCEALLDAAIEECERHGFPGDDSRTGLNGWMLLSEHAGLELAFRARDAGHEYVNWAGSLEEAEST